MKNQTLPLEVRQKIEGIKSGLIPAELVPNSRLAKDAELVQALIVLDYAKSLKRPVRKAAPNECEFTRNNQPKEKQIESPGDYLDRNEAARITGLEKSTLLYYYSKGAVAGTKIKGIVYFDKADIFRFKASRLAQKFE